MQTPHVLIQQNLAARETRDVAASLRRATIARARFIPAARRSSR
jgi:hypothetical protein